jgi:hypothetical protein
LAKPSTDCGTISVAEAQINYRCREIGMLSRAQAGLDIPSSDYSCSRDSQCVFNVESDERLVLDDKDQPSGERDTQHNKSPGEGECPSSTSHDRVTLKYPALTVMVLAVGN